MNNANHLGYLMITDYLKPNTGEDLSDAIQKVIDENPQRTLFFPDGEYLISKPICTSGDPAKAVSLELANFAVIKAMPEWSSDEAMIRLGGKDPAFTIHAVGSNNYISGGVLDGSRVAKGLSIDSGREYSIRNISMKFVTLGLHIKYNAQYGSNDSDIFNVNIVGIGEAGSVGVLVAGFDNTLTNMRIADFETGVKLTGAGNLMNNLHPLFIYRDSLDYKDSVGFRAASGGNWYTVCYPDNFATGFLLDGNTLSTFTDCYCYWYSANGGVETAFASTGKFNSVIKNTRVDFRAETENRYLKVAEDGGAGVIDNPIFDPGRCVEEDYKKHLSGRVITRK